MNEMYQRTVERQMNHFWMCCVMAAVLSLAVGIALLLGLDPHGARPWFAIGITLYFGWLALRALGWHFIRFRDLGFLAEVQGVKLRRSPQREVASEKGEGELAFR